jgi:hypothetical protein
MFRFTVAASLLLALSLDASASRWQRLKLGNGGITTNIDIATDGTMVTSTDSFGCYIWSTSQNQWVQLLNANTMPTPDASGSGCSDIRIEHGNSSNIWFLWNGNLYKSTNKGVTFTAVSAFSTELGANPNNGSPTKAYGPYIAIDPNNSSIIYASTTNQGLRFTNDGGSTFSQVTSVFAGLPAYINNTPSSPSSGTDSTSVAVGTGPKVFNNNSGSFGFAIGNTNYVQVWETSNPSNQMFGHVTASIGTTFTINVTSAQGSGTHSDWTVSTLMNTSSQIIGGGHRIAFDTSSGTISVSGQSRTKNVFVSTYGIGVYKSTDGGVTWTIQNSAGMPLAIRRMTADPFGVLWVINDMYSMVAANIQKYDGSNWSNISSGIGGLLAYNAVAYDPANCASKVTCHIAVLAGDHFFTTISLDGGANWYGSGDQTNRAYGASNDVTWLYNWFVANPTGYFAVNDVAFDPTNSGRLYMASEGVWYQVPNTSGTPNGGTQTNVITSTQQSRGIEEFIAAHIVSATGGSVFMQTWDFPCFYSNEFDAYPITVTCYNGTQLTLTIGQSIDWLWSAPSTIVSIVQISDGSSPVSVDRSGVTTAGGATPGSWKKFATPASTTNGGCIAISDANTIVWVSTDTGSNVPQITTNGGTSWSDITIPGGTPTQGWGPGAYYQASSKMCESDKSNGDIYLYNTNNGRVGDQFYKYTAATGLWSVRMHPNFNSAYFVEKMKSVPGQVGNLFFSAGPLSSPHPQNTPFYYTTDGWTTDATVTGFKEVLTFGFGATFPGKSYPSIYAAGWFTGRAIVNGSSRRVTDAYGIWMCKDFNTGTGTCTATWTRLGESYPAGILSRAVDIDGDKVTPGQVYVFTHGGAFWGQFN